MIELFAAMPRDDKGRRRVLVRGRGPKKVPARRDYGGKPPGAYPVTPKPAPESEVGGRSPSPVGDDSM